MSWLDEISNCPPIQVYSQNGEEGPLLFILEKLGVVNSPSMLVVDFGASDGKDLSNSRLLIEKGWTGRLYDIDPRGATDVIRTKITTDNAGEYARGASVLMVDLDGNDYWILDAALQVSSPLVIICEINTRFDRHESFASPYDSDKKWDNSDHFGMSLEAAIRLGRQYGYSPVHLQSNYNLFLVREDLLPDGNLPELKYGKFRGFPVTDKPWTPIP